MENIVRRLQPRTSSIVLFVASLLISALANATPSIALSKKSGPPTSRILVSGRGFEPNVRVDIYFDTKYETKLATNSMGEFHDAEITAPPSAQPGRHRVRALVKRHKESVAKKTFIVRTNWPNYNFDNRHTNNNPYENTITSSNVERLALRWRYPTGGTEAVVVNNVVYVGSDSQGSGLYALDAFTGNVIWWQPLFGSSPPVVAQGRFYVVSTNGELLALNAASGTQLWIDKFCCFNYVASPVIAKGVLYVGMGDNNYVTALYAIDAATGAVLWKYSTSGDIGAPAVSDGVVYFTEYEAAPENCHVYALDASSGALRWMYSVPNDVGGVSDAMIADGKVFFGHNQVVYALNASSGTPTWVSVLPTVSARDTWDYLTDLAFDHGMIYVGSEDNSLIALSGTTGKVLWSYSTANYAAPPSVANGLVYFASYDHTFHALNAVSGSDLWHFTLGGSVLSSPTIVNGMVFVGAEDGNFYAFSLNTSTRKRQTDGTCCGLR